MVGTPSEAAPREGQGTIARTLAQLEHYGDRIALTVDDPDAPAEWTYRDIVDRIQYEARRLDAHGVQRGDVVAIMAGNTAAGVILRWPTGSRRRRVTAR